MPDIIEQLEKGKELLESGKIDIESLKTKIESENENSDGDNSSNNISTKSNNRQSNEPKVEKYPGFDFTTMYTVGQTIFYVKVNDMIGEKELQELKLRTIYPKMLVGCLEKAYTQCIGPDTVDKIFTNRYEAVQCYDNITVKQKVYEHNVIEED